MLNTLVNNSTPKFEQTFMLRTLFTDWKIITSSGNTIEMKSNDINKYIFIVMFLIINYFVVRHSFCIDDFLELEKYNAVD